MQRVWSAEELGERWLLLPEDLALLTSRIDAGKLGFAVQLIFWRQHGRFPNIEADMAPDVVAHLAVQTGVAPADRRGLTPLVWGHVSPYGTFDLDMEARPDLDRREAA